MLAIGTHKGVYLYTAQFEQIAFLPLLSAGGMSSGTRLATSWQQLATTLHGQYLANRAADIRNSTVEPKLTNQYNLCGTLRWSRNGTQFALLSNQKLLTVVDKAASRPILSLYYGVTDFAWQFRGDQLAFTTRDGNLYLWDNAKRFYHLANLRCWTKCALVAR